MKQGAEGAAERHGQTAHVHECTCMQYGVTHRHFAEEKHSSNAIQSKAGHNTYALDTMRWEVLQ